MSCTFEPLFYVFHSLPSEFAQILLWSLYSFPHVAANVMLVTKDLVPSALRLIPVPNQTKAVAITRLFVPRQGLALITAPVVLVSVVMVSAVFQLIRV